VRRQCCTRGRGTEVVALGVRDFHESGTSAQMAESRAPGRSPRLLRVRGKRSREHRAWRHQNRTSVEGEEDGATQESLTSGPVDQRGAEGARASIGLGAREGKRGSGPKSIPGGPFRFPFIIFLCFSDVFILSSLFKFKYSLNSQFNYNA
jgi:hypothetical protein